MNHLSMDQLIALRDDDRSEPGNAEALGHFADCQHCQGELDRLHQRTARLRALPPRRRTTSSIKSRNSCHWLPRATGLPTRPAYPFAQDTADTERDLISPPDYPCYLS